MSKSARGSGSSGSSGSGEAAAALIAAGEATASEAKAALARHADLLGLMLELRFQVAAMAEQLGRVEMRIDSVDERLTRLERAGSGAHAFQARLDAAPLPVLAVQPRALRSGGVERAQAVLTVGHDDGGPGSRDRVEDDLCADRVNEVREVSVFRAAAYVKHYAQSFQGQELARLLAAGAPVKREHVCFESIHEAAEAKAE
ncbi:hypothetical protein T492DRAFT_869245 [Pavlovales sp. CCMP2436]|nr:hypothetical protein T492DRAFT_869245 [Pavlovales sp. CCMP2436]